MERARPTHLPEHSTEAVVFWPVTSLAGSINQALIRQDHPLKPAHYYVR